VARLRPVLKALSTVGKRERKTFQSIATNNFFLMSALLLQKAGAFLYIVGGLIVLFPLSADPLRAVPAERLALWPFTPAEHTKLRLITPWLNPVTWLLAALALWTVVHVESRGVLLLALGMFAIGFFVPQVSGEPSFLRRIPALPVPLGQLIRKSLREMLLTLDFYMALILSVGGLAVRLLRRDVSQDMLLALTLLLVLSLSSYAQSLFGLESESGLTRYKLLPLEGWQILAAKDVAFLLVTFVLTLPLAPTAGVGGGLVALAFGHYSSVTENRQQTRWRFSSGASLGHGLIQTFAFAAGAAAVYRVNVLILFALAAICAVSAWWYGRKLQTLE
jgi:hypothetical protein